MKYRKTVDSNLIMSLGPCPEWPEERVKKAVPKRITITEFLKQEHIPPQDRIWVVLHDVFLTDRLMRLFACDCADRSLNCEREAGREPDERSWNAVAVARRFANGEATSDELAAAGAAAMDAARAAASYAAWAASDAARASSDAASDAAWAAERDWQCEHLIEMINGEK